MKNTETILPQDKQKGYRLVFAPTKCPSSGMTPSFLVGASIDKRSRLFQSLVKTDSKRRNFCSFCSTKQKPPKPHFIPRNTSKLVQSLPPLIFLSLTLHTKPDETKGSPFQFFFGTVRNLFRKLFVSKGSSSSFGVFCSKLKFKDPKRPPSKFFGTMRLFQSSRFSFFKSFFRKLFENFQMSPKGPLSIFKIFCN